MMETTRKRQIQEIRMGPGIISVEVTYGIEPPYGRAVVDEVKITVEGYEQFDNIQLDPEAAEYLRMALNDLLGS